MGSNGRPRMPAAPEHLLPTAKDAWGRVVRGMMDAGRWDPLLRAAVAMLCQSFARWKHAQSERDTATTDHAKAAWAREEADTYNRLEVALYAMSEDLSRRAQIAAWLVGDAGEV